LAAGQSITTPAVDNPRKLTFYADSSVGGSGKTGIVEYAIGGGGTQFLAAFVVTTGGSNVVINLTNAPDLSASLNVRFRFSSSFATWYLDDVRIDAGYSGMTLVDPTDTTVKTDAFLLASNVWVADVGRLPGSGVGKEYTLIAEKELGHGTLFRTGYYAVVNQTIGSRDPAVFGDTVMRPIPPPAVTSDAMAYLTWPLAVEDPGSPQVTNVVGFTLYRSSNGISFEAVAGLPATTNTADAIPYDAEYYYALGLVYRGSPSVTGAFISANSARVFKDTDSDGLPDYFELANDLDIASGSGTNGPVGDADGDTMSNFEEWIAGTMANSAASYLFAKQVLSSGSNMVVTWDAVAGRSYLLFRNSDLRSPTWTGIHGPTSCLSNQVMQHVDGSSPEGVRFYLLKAFRH
jgi:hypothetical protein